MSVVPLLVHFIEFVIILLIVLVAYKIFINYQAVVNTANSKLIDMNSMEDETLNESHNEEQTNKPNSHPTKRETVLNDYIGDFF